MGFEDNTPVCKQLHLSRKRRLEEKSRWFAADFRYNLCRQNSHRNAVPHNPSKRVRLQNVLLASRVDGISTPSCPPCMGMAAFRSPVVKGRCSVKHILINQLDLPVRLESKKGKFSWLTFQWKEARFCANEKQWISVFLPRKGSGVSNRWRILKRIQIMQLQSNKYMISKANSSWKNRTWIDFFLDWGKIWIFYWRKIVIKKMCRSVHKAFE